LTVPVAIDLRPYKNEELVFGEQVLSTASATVLGAATNRDSKDSAAKRKFCTRFETATSSPGAKMRVPLEKSVAIIKH
jgi:hypothetical protein